ncbi:copper resistance protein CopC [Microbacterium sp. M]|uniref:copper resistance CopC family protein n=1 Tax=Microbacterium sp. M TaxID=3377125 RepID=UPI00386DC662
MRAHALRLPFLPIAIAAALLASLLILLPTTPASAHDELVSSDPAAGSTVPTLPEEMTLTFSAALFDAPDATAVIVTDAEGRSVTDGAPEIDGAVVIQKLDTDAAIAGEYTVIWQVVSSDGHTIGDGQDFTFSVASAATPPRQPTTAPATESTAPADTPATSEPESTQVPDATDSSPASAWIWALSILGILVIVAAMVWFWLHGRRTPPDADSDAPAEG